MAHWFSVALIGDTDEMKDYIKSFIKKYHGDIMQGWEVFENGMEFTVYASNNFDPDQDIHEMLEHLQYSLMCDSLPYVLKADNYNHVYEIAAKGFQIVGGYEVVGLDPDGLGAIKEYRDYRK